MHSLLFSEAFVSYDWRKKNCKEGCTIHVRKVKDGKVKMISNTQDIQMFSLE